MASTRIEHDFDCTEATFWRVTFFDPEFSRRLYLETEVPRLEVLEGHRRDVERRVEFSRSSRTFRDP
jgi:hypothetical protein